MKNGLKKGEKLKCIEIAKNMLNESISIEIIKKVTGLSTKEIESLLPVA